jgi:hypothetical protein
MGFHIGFRAAGCVITHLYMLIADLSLTCHTGLWWRIALQRPATSLMLAKRLTRLTQESPSSEWETLSLNMCIDNMQQPLDAADAFHAPAGSADILAGSAPAVFGIATAAGTLT